MRQVVEFEWDPAKAAANVRKHDVPFETAVRVFDDAFLFEINEEDFGDEMRYNVVGEVDRRLLHATYTMRGEIYRIISARAAEPHERRKYYQV
jgi:uncharacterized protein